MLQDSSEEIWDHSLHFNSYLVFIIHCGDICRAKKPRHGTDGQQEQHGQDYYNPERFNRIDARTDNRYKSFTNGWPNKKPTHNAPIPRSPHVARIRWDSTTVNCQVNCYCSYYIWWSHFDGKVHFSQRP